MSQRSRADLDQLFLHLARKPAYRAIVKPLGNIALFGLFQSFDRALLLLQVAFVLNLGLDRFKFVANRRRKNAVRGSRLRGKTLCLITTVEKFGYQFP